MKMSVFLQRCISLFYEWNLRFRLQKTINSIFSVKVQMAVSQMAFLTRYFDELVHEIVICLHIIIMIYHSNYDCMFFFVFFSALRKTKQFVQNTGIRCATTYNHLSKNTPSPLCTHTHTHTHT